jgi:hypothetical protein
MYYYRYILQASQISASRSGKKINFYSYAKKIKIKWHNTGIIYALEIFFVEKPLFTFRVFIEFYIYIQYTINIIWASGSIYLVIFEKPLLSSILYQ